MTEPALPLPDIPLIIEDLLIQAKQLADAGAPNEAIEEILDHVVALRGGQAALDKLYAQLSDGILALNDPPASQGALGRLGSHHRHHPTAKTPKDLSGIASAFGGENNPHANKTSSHMGNHPNTPNHYVRSPDSRQ